jgi:hypothetical protein
MKLLALIVSAMVSLAAVEGQAVPVDVVFDITDNHNSGLPDETVDDGDTYSGLLGLGSSVSINVRAVDTATSGSVFLNVSPSPYTATLDIVLTTRDFGLFGPVTVTLNDGATVSDTVTGANSEVILKGVKFTSPLEVSFSWAKPTTGSFNADLDISPIPLPAAGWLLLSGLGGMAALRRFARV